jgi:hypothetical protein
MTKKKRERVTTQTGGPRDPMQDQTPTARKRAAKAKKRGKDASPTDRAQCTAHKRNGDRCSNPPVRGATVCRMHGGSAPQVRAKANQRLIDMVMPAMRELRKIIDDPAAADTDKLKAINMVLNRTGYNERREIDLGLRSPTPFDDLVTSSVVILRGTDNIIEPGDEHQALPPGGDEVTDDEMEAFLEHRNRQKEREAQTHLDHRGHEVVAGSVSLTSDDDLFAFPKSQERRYAESGRTENSEGTRPGEAPWSDYERLVRERVEDRRR